MPVYCTDCVMRSVRIHHVFSIPDPMASWIPCLRWELGQQLYEMARNLERLSHRMGDGRIFPITSGPLSLINAYRKNLISAGSISLDSTFKNVLRDETIGQLRILPKAFTINKVLLYRTLFPFKIITFGLSSKHSLTLKQMFSLPIYVRLNCLLHDH